jgi:oxygen-independent coproporphyrinogen-3 oxidase
MSSATPARAEPSVQFDAPLLRKLSQASPSYTSYPPARGFSGAFGYRDYLHAVAGLRTRGSLKALAIDLHVPFCDVHAHDCAVAGGANKNRDKAAPYLGYLKREIDMQGMLFAALNQVEQLRIGAAGACYLTDAQMGELLTHLQRWFRFAPDSEGQYTIEVDLRTVSAQRVQMLRGQGFNQIRIGMRLADAALGAASAPAPAATDPLPIVEAARAARFRAVGIDLVYGLAGQSVIGLARMLDKIVKAAPDRVVIVDGGQSPQLAKPARRANDPSLPGADARLDMLSLCVRRLSEAGYVYIGRDHFARAGDELAVAQRQGRLHHNLLGYSAHADTDLIACGVAAIGMLGAAYSQNVNTLEAYYELIDQNELPIERGVKLNMDQALRRSVIQMLMCQFELSVAALEQAFPIVFSDYFAPELEQLAAFADDGLLTIEPGWLSVTLKGRLLIGTICMLFDRHQGGAGAPACTPGTP